ncbi:efflux transporter outer membrane subunit [Rhodocyclus tenuis]|uniref:NodT family efflux transporter outer membrane factor (OMF) lipoprotein n=1 Tax=Rhodocyclus tenuis TaxID=1066 RepID=A0A840G7C0_RHOTE|nr:efflux transporter outer membrane subunit [Rhodocyclus tenuis]MBB4246608.1 NodT family efflux transporter outer membrane factor (OMF) lipoprotein [Rhodocyclus tenuis]
MPCSLPRTALLAALPLLLLTACATPGDSASRASPADPATLAAQLSAGDAPWPQERWWSAFGDAGLDALVASALRESPSLRIAEARLAKARALADSAGSLRFPDVSSSLQATRQRYTENGMIPKPYAGSILTSGELALDFAYDFDFWGRNRDRLAAAVSQTRAAGAERESARLLLVAAVVQSWLRLDRSYRVLDIVEAQRTQRERQLQLTRRLFDAGLAAAGDVASADAALAAARQDMQAQREQITLQRHQIAALAGFGPDFAATLPRPQLPDPAAGGAALPSVLPADLLGRRPDLVAARWLVEAARGSAAAARAEFYPNVNLIAFAGYSSIGLGNLLKSGSGIAGWGPAISLPIFDGGRLRAGLDSANADLDLAIEQYNQTLLDAVREVADQAASLAALAGQQGEAQHALAQAAKTRELTQIRFAAGLASELTLLADDDAWLARRRALVDVNERSLETRLGLIKALGGGYDAAPQSRTHEDAPASAAQ